MRSIKEIENIEGKRVLVRVDFNLPIEHGIVLDSFRIKKALPTIEFLTKNGAKVILISHLGKGGDSLLSVSLVLKKLIPVNFIPEIIGPKVEKAIEEMKNGDVILLENLRNDEREKNCDNVFAESLAKYADIYVNESFPVNHREDASLVLLPKLLPSFAGFQLQEEVKHLSQTFENPEHPFLFILGGAKFSTKVPLIKKFLDLADHVFIGGALANDFLKAKGFEIGKSLTDDSTIEIQEVLGNPKLILPEDVVVLSGENKLLTKKVEEINKDDVILDIGEQTINKLIPHIREAKMILWNGPLGKYEEGGEKGTKNILKLVADSEGKSIIGGGDTVAIVSQMDLESKFTFVSTGGGATLEFLSKGTLPGIKALLR